MDEFSSDSESSSEQELRRTARRKMFIGAAMLTALPLLPVTLFLVQYLVPSDFILVLLIAFGFIVILGMTMLVYYGGGSSMLFRGMDILHQIAPPEPFIEGKFAVLNKDPVYGIAQWGSNALFFVAFYQYERTFDQKVKVPRVIWKWEYSHRIGELKVAKREDTFTIPVGRGIYHTGRGILYSLLLEQTRVITYPKKFTDEQLNQIVDNLIREIVSYESSHQIVNDDFE